jgi:hypothetical protein
MRDQYSEIASLHVHPEVRFRIVQRELKENARRIFELCEMLNIEPDLVSDEWTKELIGITQDVVDNAPKTLASGGGLLERLMPSADMLEYHLKKHRILLTKAEHVLNEKQSSPREWHTDGHFHWCPNCDQVFGCDSPNSEGKVTCTSCNYYGVF